MIKYILDAIYPTFANLCTISWMATMAVAIPPISSTILTESPIWHIVPTYAMPWVEESPFDANKSYL